jgi:DtxR family Mn-dependent transcriptional regulator
VDTNHSRLLEAGPAPTETVTAYLEAIYYMRQEDLVVTGARMADWLGVSRATVSATLGRMARDGYLRSSVRREIALTPRGEELAASIVRRHRIIERWLTDALGFDWAVADEEAARLEHTVSDRVADRLFETLGRPLTCPHGNPIPGAGPAPKDERRLSSVGAVQVVRLSRVSEVTEREVPALLRYLAERGLVPGADVTVLEVDEVGRTVRLGVGGKEVVLSHETASRLWAVSPPPARSMSLAGTTR